MTFINACSIAALISSLVSAIGVVDISGGGRSIFEIIAPVATLSAV
jgi:hypothetical protein